MNPELKRGLKYGLAALGIAGALSAGKVMVSADEQLYCPKDSTLIHEVYPIDFNGDEKINKDDSRDLCVDELGHEVATKVENRGLVPKSYNNTLNSLK